MLDSAGGVTRCCATPSSIPLPSPAKMIAAVKSARSAPFCAMSFRFQPAPLDESTRPANVSLSPRAARFCFFSSRHCILRSVRKGPEFRGSYSFAMVPSAAND